MRPKETPARPLTELAGLLGLNGGVAHSPVDVVTGITHDSRQVCAGDLFAALPGTRKHGAELSEQAAQAGAKAILTDPSGRTMAERSGLPVLVVDNVRARLGVAAAWVYREPARDLTLLGVTGTSGKTTVAYLIEAGLRAGGHDTGMVGTVVNRVKDEWYPSLLTTPEATDLQALLARMRERGVTAAVLEISSQAVEQGRAGGMVLDVAVFTNLSRDHLDLHSTMEEYFAAKARLFTPEHCRHGVVNVDDPYGRELTKLAGVPVTTFSAAGDPAADWHVEDLRLRKYDSTFRIVGPSGAGVDASIRLPGLFNVSNALAAVVALVQAGIEPAAAVRGVGSVTGVPGRLEHIDGGQDFDVVVDYAHKPTAVEAVLTTLRPFTGGQLIIVLGCNGDRDRGKRPMMAAAAARFADMAIFTDDNPASEDSLAILAAMIEGVLQIPRDERASITVEPDRATAIALAIDRARPGDVVVVAGHGHESALLVSGNAYPFDDRDVVREILTKRFAGQQSPSPSVMPSPHGADR